MFFCTVLKDFPNEKTTRRKKKKVKIHKVGTVTALHSANVAFHRLVVDKASSTVSWTGLSKSTGVY